MKHETEHELKILPKYFEAVLKRRKTFELRKDDRPYKEFDILKLMEFDGNNYTGRHQHMKITYILRDAPQYGLQNGYVIMGINPLIR